MKNIFLLSLLISLNTAIGSNSYPCKSSEAPSDLRSLKGKNLELSLNKLKDSKVFEYYLEELSSEDLKNSATFGYELYLNLQNRKLAEDKWNLIKIMAYMAKIDQEKGDPISKMKVCELIEKVNKKKTD